MFPGAFCIVGSDLPSFGRQLNHNTYNQNSHRSITPLNNYFLVKPSRKTRASRPASMDHFNRIWERPSVCELPSSASTQNVFTILSNAMFAFCAVNCTSEHVLTVSYLRRAASSNAKTLHYRTCLDDHCDINKTLMTNNLRNISMEPFRAPSCAQWAFEKLREHRLRYKPHIMMLQIVS